MMLEKLKFESSLFAVCAVHACSYTNMLAIRDVCSAKRQRNDVERSIGPCDLQKRAAVIILFSDVSPNSVMFFEIKSPKAANQCAF